MLHVTIWLALFAYAIAEADRVGHGPYRSDRRPRIIWTIGCLLYVAHVASAFHEYHHWSHDAAYEHVARTTAAFIGLDWGGGLYVNYAFTLVWVGETGWWWLRPRGYAARSATIDWTVRATFLFMIVNGAVVFVDGPRRWLGVLVVLVLLATWCRRRYNRR